MAYGILKVLGGIVTPKFSRAWVPCAVDGRTMLFDTIEEAAAFADTLKTAGQARGELHGYRAREYSKNVKVN